jgi:tetratricopeptide (TPR) repeat protein
MATVYLALDRLNELPVAVKVLHPELAMALGAGRFIREVQIIQRLNHPGILPLLDSGVDEGDAYYVMPYVRGGTLRDLLSSRTQLTVEESITIGLELSAALDHAHAAGVVHRDVKPENILLSDGRAIIADFGIARLVAASGTERYLSTTGFVIGTPAYMSPEQATADPKIDARSDVYSLGCVLFEMLSGIPPFAGATPQAVAARHLVESPPPLRVVRPNAPEGIASIIERCLAKSPADRYQNARELHEALKTRALERVTPSRPTRVASWAALVVLALVTAVFAARKEQPLDETRYVVFPFRALGDEAPQLLQPANAAFLVYEAMEAAEDLQLVDRARLESVMSESGVPARLTDALRLARTLGAGRFIWGEVVGRGDSVVVRGQLYRSTRKVSDPIETAEFTVDRREAAREGSGARTFLGRFTRLTRGLVVQRAGLDSSALLGTDYMNALAEKLSGDSARISWNLPLAITHYQAALRIDPQYAQAAFGLAQVRARLEQPVEEWRPALELAVSRASALGERERALARGLLALADGRFPDACATYRSLAARDSADFDAWFGLGECHAQDPEVIPDRRSASGYAFRGSYAAAADAYLRALRIVPLAHRSDRVVTVGRLERVLPTGVALRSGQAPDAAERRFLAWPAQSADTVGYVPYPWERFTGPTPPAKPPTMEALFLRNRRALSSYTEEWIRTFPSSGMAWHARSQQLERMGALEGDSTESARAAIARARSLTREPQAAADLAVDEARILLRLRDSTALGRLLDSLTASDVASPEVARALAPVAALAGNSRLLRALLRRAGPAWMFRSLNGEPMLVPRPVAVAALDLYAYALLGHSRDTIDALERTLAEAVSTWSPPSRRAKDLESLRHTPALLGFPVFGLRAAHRSPLAPQELVRQRALVEGPPATRRSVMEGARRFTSLPTSEVSPETAYLAVYALLVGGDTVAGHALLSRTLGHLDGLPMTALLTPQGPAALRRMAAMLPPTNDSSSFGARRLLRAIERSH